MSESQKLRWVNRPPKPAPSSKPKLSKREARKRIRTGLAKITPEEKLKMYIRRDSCDNRRWLHNLKGEHKRVKLHMVESLLKEGWIEGRLIRRSSNTGKFIK